jgi:hypothetical protein
VNAVPRRFRLDARLRRSLDDRTTWYDYVMLARASLSFVTSLAFVSGVLTLGACGTSAENEPTSISNKGSGGKKAGSAASGGSGGNDGGAASAGSAGGGIPISAGGSQGGGGAPTCAAEAVQADAVKLPADIIWVVDQSGSMAQETAYVQKQINAFASAIAKSDVDYRVVMIANKGGSNAICVPEPLGGPGCGNAERFRLVSKTVSSTNGPQLALSELPKYVDFLRPNATKHFVFVTDDNSKISAKQLLDGLAAQKPDGLFAGVKIHAVFAWGDDQNKGCKGPFGSGAKYGSVYESLVTTTGGAKGVICEDDWTKVFTDITTAVISGAKVSCEIEVPAPPANKTLDPDLVNVQYLPGGTSGVGKPKALVRVASAAACGAAGGWYYDDPNAPKRILLCPTTCGTVQADGGAKLDVQFGCASVFDNPT